MLTTNRINNDMDLNSNSKIVTHRSGQRRWSWDSASSDDEEALRRENQYFSKVALDLESVGDDLEMKPPAKSNGISRSNVQVPASNFHPPTESTIANNDFDSFSIPSRQDEILTQINDTTVTDLDPSPIQPQPLMKRQRSWDSSDDEESIRRDGPYIAQASAQMIRDLPMELDKAGLNASRYSRKFLRTQLMEQPLIRSWDSSDDEESIRRDGPYITAASAQMINDLPMMLEKAGILSSNTIRNIESNYFGYNYHDKPRLGEKDQHGFSSQQESISGTGPKLLNDNNLNEQYDDDDYQIFVGSSLDEIELEEKRSLLSSIHHELDKGQSVDDLNENTPSRDNRHPASTMYYSSSRPFGSAPHTSASSNQTASETNMQTQTQLGKRKLQSAEQQMVFCSNSTTDVACQNYVLDTTQYSIQSQVEVNQHKPQGISKSGTKTTQENQQKSKSNKEKGTGGSSRQRIRQRHIPRTPDKKATWKDHHQPQFQSPFRLFLSAGRLMKSGQGPSNVAKPLHSVSSSNNKAGSLKTSKLFALYENYTSQTKRSELFHKQPKPKEDPSLGVAMVSIEHLSKKVIVDGLPVWNIALHAGIDGTFISPCIFILVFCLFLWISTNCFLVLLQTSCTTLKCLLKSLKYKVVAWEHF
jgi:hypothetical protein